MKKTELKTLPEKQKPTGRPRDAFAQIEGQEAFASRWNYPLELVRQAKKDDLPGFLTGGRIDPALAIPAINAMRFDEREMPAGCTTWKQVGEKYRGLKAQLEFDEKKKELMPTSDAKRQNGEAWAYVFGQLDQLCVEAPPEWAGRNAVELYARLTKFRENMRMEAKKRFEEAA